MYIPINSIELTEIDRDKVERPTPRADCSVRIETLWSSDRGLLSNIVFTARRKVDSGQEPPLPPPPRPR